MTPVRREVLVLGKFLAGVLGTMVVLGAGVLLSFTLQRNLLPQALFPVELPVTGISGLFTVVAEPTPAWLAVSGLVVFAGAVLAFACWRIRRFEVSYSTD